jgi:O-antigen ligase
MMLVVTMARRVELRRRAVVVCAAGAVVAACALPLGWEMISSRWEETTRAMERYEQGKGRGDAVTRLRSWEAAWQMFRGAPWGGVGTGDFPAEVGKTEAGATIADARHAHNTYLHVLACNGLMGFGLMMAFFWCAMRDGWREKQNWMMADGALFAMIAWLVAAWFDAYQQNGQMLGLFVWLAAMSGGNVSGRELPVESAEV